mmetsp:Transcript_93502/g.165382  ORF Transcript_93502/g.165382 Transcript_93502/m.165382 type:complete len:367 (-) Transcript_93502:136-1236(-)
MAVQSWLNQPPDQVASMMAKSIGPSMGGAPSPGAIPLNQVLTELKGLPPGQKSALMQKAVQGMGTLPPKDQAQLISLGMKMQKNAQAGQAISPEQQQIIALAQDAVKDVPPQELNKVTACAQQTAKQAIQDPAKLFMVAKELPATDRLELQQTLVANKIVPPQQEALLSHALQPNGPLDQIAIAAEYLEMAKPYAQTLLLVPVVEWCLGFVFSLFPCDASLPEWLCWDGFGMVFTFAGFYLAYMNFEHIKAIAMNPPPGLQEAALAQNLDGALNSIPPEQKTTVMLGVGGLAIALVGILCQVCWALYGVTQILDMGKCNAFVAFVCKIVIAAKSFLVLGMIGYCAYQGKQIWDKMHGGYAPAYSQE